LIATAEDGFFAPDRIAIFGVLNTTPDSFSDGGRFVCADGPVDVAGAVVVAKDLLASGADVIDIGGESTRPGSHAVAIEVELERTLPVVEALVAASDASTWISIDTRKGEVARAALAAGARIVNDVSGLAFDPDLAGVAAEADAWLVLGHMRGTPATMQRAPHYDDVLAEVATELEAAIAHARRAGVREERLVVDPGIGFGKRFEDNHALLANVGWLRERLALPVLVGPSRKGFLGALVGDAADARDRATHAACAIAAFAGADGVRVHDVAGARDALAVARTLRAARVEGLA